MPVTDWPKNAPLTSLLEAMFVYGEVHGDEKLEAFLTSEVDRLRVIATIAKRRRSSVNTAATKDADGSRYVDPSKDDPLGVAITTLNYYSGISTLGDDDGKTARLALKRIAELMVKKGGPSC